ncbi:MAG: hypothetical protein QE271_04535, partial [Bacteriovoracaceae bacterium]|nr:hypothetical protein [Bacteriovoracaceae bacterium]
ALRAAALEKQKLILVVQVCDQENTQKIGPKNENARNECYGEIIKGLTVDGFSNKNKEAESKFNAARDSVNEAKEKLASAIKAANEFRSSLIIPEKTEVISIANNPKKEEKHNQIEFADSLPENCESPEFIPQMPPKLFYHDPEALIERASVCSYGLKVDQLSLVDGDKRKQVDLPINFKARYSDVKGDLKGYPPFSNCLKKASESCAANIKCKKKGAKDGVEGEFFIRPSNCAPSACGEFKKGNLDAKLCVGNESNDYGAKQQIKGKENTAKPSNNKISFPATGV